MKFMQRMKLAIWCLAFVLGLSGCATAPKLSIRSTVPARVELDGSTVCEQTPCTIEGNHYRDGYNLGCVRGDDNRLEAFPLDPKAGYRQSKVVRGGCKKITDVFFDMESAGAVNTIQKTSAPPSK